MKVPKEELMSDILRRLTGESALPVYSNIEKFKRVNDDYYIVAEDFHESVRKREQVNAKERLRVSERVRRITSILIAKSGYPILIHHSTGTNLRESTIANISWNSYQLFIAA